MAKQAENFSLDLTESSTPSANNSSSTSENANDAPEQSEPPLEENTKNIETPSTTPDCGMDCTCLKLLCSTSQTRDYEVTKLDLTFSIISLIFYIADFGTDIWMAIKHRKNGDTRWMQLTIAFIITPSLVGILLLIIQWCGRPTKRKVLNGIMVIPGGLAFK